MHEDKNARCWVEMGDYAARANPVWKLLIKLFGLHWPSMSAHQKTAP